MLTLSVRYEPLNSIVEFMLFSYKRLCTVPFGVHHSVQLPIQDFPDEDR